MPYPQASPLVALLEEGIREPGRAPFCWVGAGLSIPAGYPSWGQLAERIRNDSLYPLSPSADPMETVDAYVDANGKGRLARLLTDVFVEKPSERFHRDLMRLPWKGVVTTNYDGLLEHALTEIGRSYLTVTLEQNLDLTAGPHLPLYKVHGSTTDLQEVILDGRSYATYGDRYPLLVADFESMLRKHSVIYWGCSMTDPRLVEWLDGLGTDGRARLMTSCAVMTEDGWARIPDATQRLLDEANIQPVLLNHHDEIPDLISYLVRAVRAGAPAAHLQFSVAIDEDGRWRVRRDGGAPRTVDAPWRGNPAVALALRDFQQLAAERADDTNRGLLYASADRLGEALGQALWTDADRQHIRNAGGQDGPPPLVSVESDDDAILALPWELIRLDSEYAVQAGRIDLVRSTRARSDEPILLEKPDRPLSLLVNVSAPEGEGGPPLDYERESYRIARALHDHVGLAFTELGTVDDLLKGLADEDRAPLGFHFSGHGMPGQLLFENDEGFKDEVEVADLLARIRNTETVRFPRFAYLASCHGNTPMRLDTDEDAAEGADVQTEADRLGSTIAVAHLHREGITQVIGYFGPIVDELSTAAEETIYRALGAGHTTVAAVREARDVLARGGVRIERGVFRRDDPRAQALQTGFPFAWAQLVLYHRGPNLPLSTPVDKIYVEDQEALLQRTFDGDVLTTGFIGRRRERHAIRRRLRDGHRTFVFQGLGGLGKTTLAYQTLRLLNRPESPPALAFKCGELAATGDPAAELVRELSGYAQNLFGEKQWGQVVFTLDRQTGDDPAERFVAILSVLVNNLPRLVVYFDNLESLMEDPATADAEAFGTWRSPAIETIWQALRQGAEQSERLVLVASVRYRHPDFDGAYVPVTDLGPHAVFRLMAWFPALRRLSAATRAKLVGKLQGHPRAVEFLDALLRDALRKWEDRRGSWRMPDTEEGEAEEWTRLMSPALPTVAQQLRDDLLLDALWTNVLDETTRLMLFRATLLYRPADWDTLCVLGDPDATLEQTEAVIERLRQAALLNTTEVIVQTAKDPRPQRTRRYYVHAATTAFVREQIPNAEAAALAQATYLRLGTYLEELAKTSPDLTVDVDAGHYLFKARAFDRSNALLGSVAEWLQVRGRVREAISLLAPFEAEAVAHAMKPKLQGRVLGAQGAAYTVLGEVRRAVGYTEQALGIFREIGDWQGEANGLIDLGHAFARLGEVERAVGYTEQALGIFRENGDRRGEGRTLCNLGGTYTDLGEVGRAVGYTEQALAVFRETGDRRGEGTTLCNLGLAHVRLGEVGRAIEHFEQALGIFREIGDRRGEGTILGSLGNAYAQLDEVWRAIRYTEQALAISRETGDRHREGNRLVSLGIAYAKLGEMKRAVECYEQALAIGEAVQDPQITNAMRSLLEEIASSASGDSS
ncbi:MAG: tetratricopeptide repeat protein [Bacteroidota bacterium]